MVKVYYSHSMQKYRTEEEDEELLTIKHYFRHSEIVNPRDIVPSDGGMTKYLQTLETCPIVVFSTFEGMVGKGVYDEVVYALQRGKEVNVIDKVRIKPFRESLVIVDDDRAVHYAKITPRERS